MGQTLTLPPMAVSAATPTLPLAAVPPSAHGLATPALTAPAGQVAPALLGLTTSSDGTQHLTLRLEPAELGTVNLRIDRPADAPAHVDISVSRPETLTLMLRDQAQLHRALDQAGVPTEGRTVSLHLGLQDPDSRSHQPNGFDQAATNGRTPRRYEPIVVTTGEAAEAALSAPASPMRWQRVGLDITA